MKFITAKNETTRCTACKTYILRDEEEVQFFMGKTKKILCFHIICYIEWYTDMFSRKWKEWQRGINPRPKRGRPVLVKEPSKAVEINRLRTLLNYHTKLGHEEKIKAIQKRLWDLR